MTEKEMRRILYKAARAAHDGVCPNCGALDFIAICNCGFVMTPSEQRTALTEGTPEFMQGLDEAISLIRGSAERNQKEIKRIIENLSVACRIFTQAIGNEKGYLGALGKPLTNRAIELMRDAGVDPCWCSDYSSDEEREERARKGVIKARKNH